MPRATSLPEQHSHQDEIRVDAIDQNGVALQALDLESNFLVERDGVCIAFPDGQLNPVKPKLTGCGKRPLDQPLAKTSPPNFRQQAHPQNAAMGVNWPRFAQRIAPANHLTGGQGDQLRIALFDIV